jgi:glucose-1-phosphate cytidylyltransferase
MVPIGSLPIIWHLMRYYAHYGHTEFILCLGHKGDVIRNYFEAMCGDVSPDFIESASGVELELPEMPTPPLSIHCVETGIDSSVGQRLRSVRDLVKGEEVFLANYVDGLSDAFLPRVIDRFLASRKTACFLGVRPQATFHLVSAGDDGAVRSIDHVRSGRFMINGGFFVLRREIFDVLKEGEDLVDEPFHRLIKADQLLTYRHDGFWACMDTFREKQVLEDLYSSGNAPWMVWKEPHR